MKILKFTLCGKTAFFKKPDVNTYLYFTYGNIHKVALLGIFGAILGYSGYNRSKLMSIVEKVDEKRFPEFYEKLKDLKISIKPNSKNGSFSKKLQTFNNSVGYASQEQGGNLIVKEQWLENPSWDIYVVIDSEESKNIMKAILNKSAIFIPYLGKNDHLADIKEAEIINDNEVSLNLKAKTINCLCPKSLFDIYLDDDENDDDEKYEETFKYEESLPIALDEESGMYRLEKFFLQILMLREKIVLYIK
ncbi:type I-B CRISPR-associated protein Cas5b [Clostridium botulinum]|uniref:type I-B CRISPR-associated protein Cas5b n=1 Tax=Clostridium botulinum TaxID=1491 RepID=UPI0003A5F33F